MESFSVTRAPDQRPQTTFLKPTSRLLALPAELRAYIWSLALTTEDEIDVFTATSPSTAALLHTCRQVYSEAVGYHKIICDRYWRTSGFVLDVTERCCDNSRLLDCIANLRECDLNQVTKLEIRGSVEYWYFDKGIWTCSRSAACCQDNQPRWSKCPDRAFILTDVTIQADFVNSTSWAWMRNTRWGTGSFYNLKVDCDLEAAKEVSEWPGLTRRELEAVSAWYYDVMRSERRYISSGE